MKISQLRRKTVTLRYTNAAAPPLRCVAAARVPAARVAPVSAISDHQPSGQPPDAEPYADGGEGRQVGDADGGGRCVPGPQGAHPAELDAVEQGGDPREPLQRLGEVADREE